MAAVTVNVCSLSLLSTLSAPKLNASSSSASFDCTNSPLQYRQGRQLRWRRTRPSPPVVFSVPPSSVSQHRVDELRGEEEEEQMECLIGVIRSELAAASVDGSDDRRVGTDALGEKLQLVDLIQRLGIPRFFEPQIRTILETTFRHWDEKHGLGDGESTVLAFRLLRLDGFHVSSDVIENLKDGSGEFSSFSVESPEKISGMINLYRCSQTGFPSESKRMGEAKDFSVKQLRRALLEGDPSVLEHDNLRREVKFALEYPRRYLLWRLESRSIIRQLWPSTGIKNKCLQLAKLDVEMLQKMQKEEAAEIMKWWVDSGVPELEFARNGVFKCYFAVSVAIFEPQFAAFRASFTRSACVGGLVDDLFDHPSSDLDGLARFAEAFRRWDASLLDDLPQHKVVLTALQSTVVALAAESSKAQGRELFPFFKAQWDDLLTAFVKEAEWRINKQVPAWNEYVDTALVSALGILVWTSMFSMGEIISDDTLKHVGKDSRFGYLVLLVARLSNDLATFEREARHGEVASSVNSYLKENPDSSKEEAIAALRSLIESACQELELELFMSRGPVPECCSRALLNLARTYEFTYKRADAFSRVCDGEYEDLFKDYLFGFFE